MAAVAEGDGAGDRFREVEPQQDAVGVGDGFATAGAEAMELQRAAGSTVHVDVGKKLDPDLLSEPGCEHVAAAQQAAHLARIAGGLGQRTGDGVALFEHAACLPGVACAFQVGGGQERGDALPCAGAPEQGGCRGELCAGAEALQRQPPLAPAACFGIGAVSAAAGPRPQPRQSIERCPHASVESRYRVYAHMVDQAIAIGIFRQPEGMGVASVSQRGVAVATGYFRRRQRAGCAWFGGRVPSRTALERQSASTRRS